MTFYRFSFALTCATPLVDLPPRATCRVLQGGLDTRPRAGRDVPVTKRTSDRSEGPISHAAAAWSDNTKGGLK
jgi:hypothetical protein